MTTRVDRLGVALAALIVVSPPTAVQKAQRYAAPYPRDGVIKLGESDRVIAWEILRPKGAMSPMYELPLNQVLVRLTEGAVKFTKSDGTSRIERRE